MTDDLDICECGHTFEDYDEIWCCTVEDCDCAFYEDGDDES